MHWRTIRHDGDEGVALLPSCGVQREDRLQDNGPHGIGEGRDQHERQWWFLVEDRA